jgi:tetratricopeptide (TPR) repeat protein
MSTENHEISAGRRLSTWKEIAGYFGKDERTVKRWETARKLPVRRLPNGPRSTVFAYERDLAAWLDTSQTSGPEAHPGDQRQPIEPPAAARPFRRVGPGLAASLAAIAILLACLFGSHFATGWRPPALGTQNAEAAEFYRLGHYEWQTRTPAGLKRSIDDFTQAIVHDPSFAEAYAGLASAYNLAREFSDMPASEAYPRAQAAAERAIALNPSLGGAHASLAFVNFYWLRNVSAARTEFERAEALAPSDPVVHLWYANCLVEIGDAAAALKEIDAAQSLDGGSTAILANKGFVLYYAGRPDEAIALWRRMEEAEPEFPSPHGYLAGTALYRGDNATYLRELKTLASIRHDHLLAAMAAAGEAGLVQGGRRGMLAATAARQVQAFSEGQVQAYTVAETYALLGDSASAIQWLERSLARNEPGTIGIGINPAFAALRTQSSFRTLVSRAGLRPPAS